MKSRAAFSLIEVLVAMAIFALGVTVLARTYVNTLNALRDAEDNSLTRQDFAFVRRQILTAATREQLEDGGTVETFRNGRADWSAEIEETDIIDLFRVRIEIEFFDSDESVEQVIHALRPNWSEQEDRDQLLQDKTEALEKRRYSVDWL